MTDTLRRWQCVANNKLLCFVTFFFWSKMALFIMCNTFFPGQYRLCSSIISGLFGSARLPSISSARKSIFVARKRNRIVPYLHCPIVFIPFRTISMAVECFDWLAKASNAVAVLTASLQLCAHARLFHFYPVSSELHVAISANGGGMTASCACVGRAGCVACLRRPCWKRCMDNVRLRCAKAPNQS